MKKRLTLGLNFEDSVKMEWLKQQTKLNVGQLFNFRHSCTRAIYIVSPSCCSRLFFCLFLFCFDSVFIKPSANLTATFSRTFSKYVQARLYVVVPCSNILFSGSLFCLACRARVSTNTVFQERMS